jgi:hypothetical protein
LIHVAYFPSEPSAAHSGAGFFSLHSGGYWRSEARLVTY